MHCSDFQGHRGLVRFFLPLAAGILLFSHPGMALAKTLYVSDDLIINFRAGKGSQYRIIRTLKTGTPVEVLGEDKDHLQVRLQNGDEGYVLKQYMTDELPKIQVITALQKENDRLKAQLGATDSGRAEIEAQLAASLEQQRQLQVQLAETTAALQKVQARYDDLGQKSENVVAIVDERDRLASENVQLSAELTGLREENSTLLRTAMIQWFLAGAGVFGGGWIFGRISRKKRRNGFA
ncbi:MAG: hypothetical protein A2X84_05480 [Desulfuromonadaceae bacterium GWC2_58_13]|nr:MAG: hypothetical protein A2X84_05480 [Desulfuromonadaceae bacterium GWC2_58_13]